MCLYTNILIPKKADHDIVCFKIVGYKDKLKCICPPYNFMCIKLGERYDIEENVKPDIRYLPNTFFWVIKNHPERPEVYIQGGVFHSYKKLDEALVDLPHIHDIEHYYGNNTPWFIVECKIPQGTEYWEGWARVCGNTEPETYASRSIVYTDNIIGFDKRASEKDIKNFIKYMYSGFSNYKRYLRTNWYVK